MSTRQSPGDHPESVWTIVVAAGSGNRFGGAKQYHLACGRRVLDWSISAAHGVSDGIVLVVHPDYLDRAEPSVFAVVKGGQTRAESVRNGLAAVPGSATVILVHDAARPCATPELFKRVVAHVVNGAHAVVPGVMLNDTIKRVELGGDGITLVAETLPRDRLRAIQTPQGFRADVVRDMYAGGLQGTDDASIAEAHGIEVVIVDGEVDNIKVTHRDDAQFIERVLKERVFT